MKKSVDSFYERLKQLDSNQQIVLYSEYSQRGKHYHQLIWTNLAILFPTNFIGIWSLHDFGPFSYSLFASVFLVLLLLSNKLAENHREQWAQALEVTYALEEVWNIRLKGSKNPLGKQIHKTGSTRRIRRLFIFICMMFWIIAVILKWFKTWE